MITIFYTDQNKLLHKEITGQEKKLPRTIIWFDLVSPSAEEKKFVEKLTNIEIPSSEEMQEIEVSSRLYFENNAHYLTATMIANTNTQEPKTDAVSFILSENYLVTVRYIDPQPFRSYIARSAKLPETQFMSTRLILGLLENIIDRVADILELAGKGVDIQSQEIFRPQVQDNISAKIDFQKALREIGTNGDIIAKARESLLSFNRIISYLSQAKEIKIDTQCKLRFVTLTKDIASLSDHATFLSNKVNFLLDATLGMINIEQNAIIKIFSVAAVIFLPPTLIASIYGMNFHLMPELDWNFGYPLAIVFMVLSAWLPYKYFKRRKWL